MDKFKTVNKSGSLLFGTRVRNFSGEFPCKKNKEMRHFSALKEVSSINHPKLWSTTTILFCFMLINSGACLGTEGKESESK